MIKKIGKKNSVLLISIINIIMFLSAFFIRDMFYVLFGHPEYCFTNIKTMPRDEYYSIINTYELVTPYVRTTFVIIFIYSIYCVIKSLKFKKQGKKYRFLYWLNLFIFVFYMLIWISTLYFTITVNGILG